MSNARTPPNTPFQHGLITRIGDYIYPVFERVVGEDAAFMENINESLDAARNEVTREQYIARALGIATITGGVMWAFSFIAVIVLVVGFGFEVGVLVGVPISNDAVISFLQTIRTPAVMVFLALTVGSISFFAGFIGTVINTRFTANARAREINTLLPDVIGYMYALSVGGLDHLEIIEAVAESEAVYGDVSHEFQTILRDMQYLDVDYRNAIRNRAVETPSEDLDEFLTDMLSIIDSGGDLSEFLSDKREKHLKKVKTQQRRALDSLSLFGEMYMTLSMFPLMFIILLIAMSLLDGLQTTLLYLTVYGLIPITCLVFIVLISMSKIDEMGGSFIPTDTPGDADIGESYSPTTTARYKDRSSLLARFHRREQLQTVKKFIANPVTYFVWNPAHTLGITVPTAIAFILIMYSLGAVPVTWSGLQDNAFWGTVVYFYIPVLIVATAYAVCSELNHRARYGILDDFTEALRKLASANATGLTLLEAIETVADTTSGKLGEEFEQINRKVKFGDTVEDALLDFNNQYQIPRLTRTVKLVTEVQKTSNHISHVLSTAAETSENHDDLEREQKEETRMQVAIIVMTSLTLLGVLLILKTQFVSIFGDLPTTQASGGAGFTGINEGLIGMLMFHAVTLQAISAGILSGYLRYGDIRHSVKYVVGLLILTGVVWGVIA